MLGPLSHLANPLRYRRPGAVVHNGEPARVHCYGIASVYTPEYNRGKGYASRMMRLLHWVLAPSGALGPFPEEWGMAPKIPSTVLCADATFSSLWSDVGAFYGACGPSPSTNGWEIQGNVSTVWQIGESSRSEPLNDSKGWRWMESDEVSKCWEGESHRMIGDMCDQSHDATSSLFAFLPENGVAEFQRLRMLSRLQKAGIYLAFWGLSANSGPQDGLVTWTVELNGPPTLIVTRFRAKEHSDYKTIILGLLEYAKSQGLQRMEIWGLPPQVHEVASETGGQTVQREEHLPAYRWYGAQTDVVWAFNEK